MHAKSESYKKSLRIYKHEDSERFDEIVHSLHENYLSYSRINCELGLQYVLRIVHIFLPLVRYILVCVDYKLK